MYVGALAQFGFGYAVATLGTATTPVHVAKLLRLTDELVFSYDGDSAGRKAAWRALEVSLPLATDAKPIRFLFLPAQHDPDSYVREHGKDAFEKLVREAPTLSEFLIAELRSQADLATAEGRSKFLVAAKPLLQKIAAPALRLQLLKAVADLAQVTQDEAERLLELARPGPAYASPAPARRQAQPPSSHEWKLLAYVAAFPGLATELDFSTVDSTTQEGRALGEVAEWSRRHVAAGMNIDALLIERFQGEPYAELLFAAQAYPIQLKLTEEEARAQIGHEMKKLEIQRKQQDIRLLHQRLHSGALSKDELRRYSQMISEVKQLEQTLKIDEQAAP
jgi:DNA primase